MAITIRELARLAGVSAATVSLVLSGKHEGRVGETRQARILALAREHGYRLNVAARGLAEGRTYRIGICVRGGLARHVIIGEFSLYERLGLFSRGIQEAGYAIEIVQVAMRRPADAVAEDLCRRDVDGFVFLAWQPPRLGRLLRLLGERGIPAVASGTTLRGEEFTWTDIDRRDVFERATEYLIEEGHSRIALLDIDPGFHSRVKIDAFVRTVKRSLNRDGRRWVFRAPTTTLGSVLEATGEALRKMRNATALILTDNFYGEAVLRALHERGIAPGEAFRILGFGDTVLADRCSPRLSHYSFHIADQVSYGLDALIEEIRDPTAYRPRWKKFRGELMERET